MSAPFARLGRVIRAHGLDGTVVLEPARGLEPGDLTGLGVWVVPPLPDGAVLRTITSCEPAHRGWRVALDSIGDAGDARALSGRWLLTRGDMVPSPEARAGTVGFAVNDEVRGPLGTVHDTIVTGANDVLVVEDGPYGQVLVPVIDDVVLSVDEEARTISVRLLPGLIDEEPS